MVLQYLQGWEPFRIDALGLVTMIGAEEMDWAIGRLVRNPWVEYLPFLGGYVVAGNRFVKPIPGTSLYNISDGIVATDVSGWIARWLNAQDLSWNITAFVWSVRQTPTPRLLGSWRPLIIGAVLNGGMLALSILVQDWFGLANTIALIAMVVARWYMLEQNRTFLDREATSLRGPSAEFVKTMCILSDGRAVTLFAPRGLVTNGFLTTPRPYKHLLYRASRALCWLAFGFHVVCIGQATLFLQIITVVIMVGATVLCCLKLGSNEYSIGRRLHIHPVDATGLEDRRSLAYARLGLSDDEESAMLAWGLIPQKTNRVWWEHYRQAKRSTEVKVSLSPAVMS